MVPGASVHRPEHPAPKPRGQRASGSQSASVSGPYGHRPKGSAPQEPNGPGPKGPRNPRLPSTNAPKPKAPKAHGPAPKDPPGNDQPMGLFVYFSHKAVPLVATSASFRVPHDVPKQLLGWRSKAHPVPQGHHGVWPGYECQLRGRLQDAHPFDHMIKLVASGEYN